MLLYLSSISLSLNTTSSNKVSPISLDHIRCYYYAHRKCCMSYNNYHQYQIFQFMRSTSHLPCSFVHIFHRTQYSGYSQLSENNCQVKKKVIFSHLKSGFLTRPWIRKENYCKTVVFLIDPQNRKCSWTWGRPGKPTETPPEISKSSLRHSFLNLWFCFSLYFCWGLS